MTPKVSKAKREDTLLFHCVSRAVVADMGVDAAIERFGTPGKQPPKWQGVWIAAKATPKASRVAAFIILWAVGMREERKDAYSITEYQRYWNENERQAYRMQADFRELWPEFDTPNEVARQLLDQIAGPTAPKDAQSLAMKLLVTA